MVDNKELEEAFFNEVDLCLEDHENFQHGLEDARTAFNETFEYHEPFDIAELLFNKGAHWRDKKVQDLENKLKESNKAVRNAAEINRLLANRNDDLNQKLKIATEALEDGPENTTHEQGGVKRKMTWKESSEFFEGFTKSLSKELVEYRRMHREQSKKLKEAVSVIEFYADKDNYALTTHQRPRMTIQKRILTVDDCSHVAENVHDVGGKRARDYLKKHGVKG